MEILKSNKAIQEKFKTDKLMSAHIIRINGYGALSYDCSCGQTHSINDREVKCTASAKPIKALLKCPNDFYTMIRIDGYFKKKVISEYGYDAKLLNK